MHISDIKIDHDEYIGHDRLIEMFEKQDELRQKYEIPILDPDLPADQHIAREFAWNVTEEAGEVLDVFFGSRDANHLKDELADCISFYLELLLISGFTKEDLEPAYVGPGDFLQRWFDSTETTFYENEVDGNPREFHSRFLEALALSINHLKNRKWRKTNLKTNVFLYKASLYRSFRLFIQFIKSLQITPHDLFDSYLRKHQVNLFRINSKY